MTCVFPPHHRTPRPSLLLLAALIFMLPVERPDGLAAGEKVQAINGNSQTPDKANIAQEGIVRETREVSGWKVHINKVLLDTHRVETERALELLKGMLDEIVRVVPKPAVVELQKVPLYFSPEYPGGTPRAAFHPDSGWLKNHDRDPVMARGVEFTNVRIFEKEQDRMPNFALHELAHAYHYRVLAGGFGNAEIKAAYEHAKASGKYDNVEVRHGNGRPNTFARAYAMTNPQEYFAENTEAFFSRNDFFPFTHEELKKHDPEMFALLEKLWGTQSEPASTSKP